MAEDVAERQIVDVLVDGVAKEYQVYVAADDQRIGSFVGKDFGGPIECSPAVEVVLRLLLSDTPPPWRLSQVVALAGARFPPIYIVPPGWTPEECRVEGEPGGIL